MSSIAGIDTHPDDDVAPVTGLRGTRSLAYTLLTPGNHFASRLPHFPGAVMFKLVTPRLAPARFAQYLLALPHGAATHATIAPGFEHFLFGLEGGAYVQVGERRIELGDGGFAYVPADVSLEICDGAQGGARLLWLKRRYEVWPGLEPPVLLGGHRREITATATGVPGLHRRELLAADRPAYDFNMTLMSFQAGVGLPQIEIHDEEHGLYMTAGGGVYHLAGDDHPVSAGDFIYMAPYCPQGFRADGAGAEYLLYKDVYRDGF